MIKSVLKVPTALIQIERWPGCVGNSAVFNIVDHGEGVPDEFRSKVFQRFAQAHPLKTNARKGTGLGLSINKTMVEKMDGHIGFESVVGWGTHFHVRMPLVTAH